MIKPLTITATVLYLLMGINMPATSAFYSLKDMGYEFGDDCEMSNRDGDHYQGKIATVETKRCETGKECVVSEYLTCIGDDVTEHPDYSKPPVSIIAGSYLCVADLATGISYNCTPSVEVGQNSLIV